MTRSIEDPTRRDTSLAALDRISGRAIDLSSRRLDAMSLNDEDTEEFDRGARTALQLLRLAMAAGDTRAQYIKEASAHEASAEQEGLSDDRLGELVREYDEKFNRLGTEEKKNNASKSTQGNAGRRGGV